MNANDLNKSAGDGKDLNSGNEPENSQDAPVNDDKSVDAADDLTETEKTEPEEEPKAAEEKAEVTKVPDDSKPAEETKEESSAAEPALEKEEEVTEKEPETKEEKEAEETEKVKDEAHAEESKEEGSEHDETKETEKIIYIQLSKEKLVESLKNVLHNYAPHKIKNEVEAIKSAFYKKRNAEVEDLKKKFIETGEKEEDFTPPVDTLEEEFKNLLQEYKNKRAEYLKRIEDEKEQNYQAKLEVIKGIEELINKQESLGETFTEFNELQKRWEEIGNLIPNDKKSSLWTKYNFTRQKFYDYIKINKELRDLDLKKNLEQKIQLCEKAEALLLEPTIIKAFKQLQELHDEWREIGPVPLDKKDEIWARFKDVTTKINKRHQEYFEGLKEQLKKNLEAKTELCEKAEVLSQMELNSPREWEAKSKELVELQQIWKTIGFAPKKDNNLIYERFRAACDNFFNKKREFFKNYKKEQQHNLQLKMELCDQAEAMKDSTDWKRTTEEYIRIQKKWKQIGPVPRKQSDAVWKRFRSACDTFFRRKSDFFKNIDSEHEKNLELKEKLIEEVKEFKPGENTDENFKALQEFQKRWNEIGHVPIGDKERVNQEFRKYINKHYDSLNLDEFSKNIQKFRNKLENLKSSDNFMSKLIQERNKIITRLKQLENDITTWENNIGFFAKSKSSEVLVKDFHRKIENGKQNIKLFNKKLDIIDSMMN
jgi:hypothetical protein